MKRSRFYSWQIPHKLLRWICWISLKVWRRDDKL